MAQKFNDFGTDGNLTTAGNYDGAALPTTNDDVHIADTSTTINGLDFTSGGSGFDLGDVTVHETCLSVFGKDDQFVQLELDSLYYNGRGPSAYLEVDADEKLVVQGTGSGDLYLLMATAQDLNIIGAANVTVWTGSNVNDINKQAGGTLTIQASVTKGTNKEAFLFAGTTYCSSNIPLNVFPGATAYARDSAAPGTVEVQSGGVFHDESDADVGAVVLRPGAKLVTKNNPAAKTNTSLEWWKGAEADIYDDGNENVQWGTVTFKPDGWGGPGA